MTSNHYMTCKKSIFRLWILVLLLMVSINVIFSQEVPQIISFESSDYYAAHQNWMISQDCEGLIYIANSDGVLIYNGMDWQKITMPNRQRPRAVYLGSDCKMYAGGFEYFGYINNEIRPHPRFVSLTDSILTASNQEIWNIMGIDDEIIFQSFSNIYRYNANMGINPIVTPTNIMLGASINKHIYVPRIEQGIYQLKGDSLSLIEQSQWLPARSKIASMTKGNSGDDLVIGTQFNGLFTLSRNVVLELKKSINTHLKKEQINKILSLENGDYAIGTILNGLYITDSIFNIKYHINKENGLINNTVLSLFQDKVGDLWVGMDKGINLIKLKNANRFHYDRKGVLGNVFTSIFYNDQLYLGTNQGLFRQSTKGNYTLVENSQGQTWSLLEADGDLLIGHNNGTFQLLDDRCVKICEETGGWDMFEVEPGIVLQSTYNGLITLAKTNGRWQLKQKLKNGGLQISKFRIENGTILGNFSNYGLCILKLNNSYSEVLETIKLDEIDGVPLQDGLIFTLPPDPLGLIVDGKVYALQENKLVEVTADKKIIFEKSLQYNSLISNIKTHDPAINTNFIDQSKYPEKLLLGTDDGYMSVFNEGDWTSNSSIELDYYMINGKVVEEQNPDFDPNENDLIVQLASKVYDITHYFGEFRLNGWDTSYYPIPENGKLEFLNLDDGDYELLIKDQSSNVEQVLSFSISPHWYESKIGFLLYFLLGLTLLYIVNKKAQRQYRKEQEALIMAQQKELETAQMKARNENLEKEILYKSKMLANSTLALAQKNKMLGDLRAVIQKETANGKSISIIKNKIYQLIDRNINNNKDWEIFEQNFAAVHKNFLDQLKVICPQITTGELKLAAYIKMNLVSKEIAPLLNISVRSIENKRYRLRKKLGVDKDKSLKEFLMML